MLVIDERKERNLNWVKAKKTITDNMKLSQYRNL